MTKMMMMLVIYHRYKKKWISVLTLQRLKSRLFIKIKFIPRWEHDLQILWWMLYGEIMDVYCMNPMEYLTYIYINECPTRSYNMQSIFYFYAKSLNIDFILLHLVGHSLTFRHRASCILGQAFHSSPENAFYIFNQQIYFIIWYLLDRASLM